MKLSEAMMLGSVLVTLEPGVLESCAYGSALRAVGARPSYVNIVQLWPWTSDDSHHLGGLGSSVYRLFDCNVCVGKMTFEQLVDYVRSIEPECGECNRFECSCVKPSVEQSVSGVELKEKVSK